MSRQSAYFLVQGFDDSQETVEDEKKKKVYILQKINGFTIMDSIPGHCRMLRWHRSFCCVLPIERVFESSLVQKQFEILND
ncbi:unnamed protein product (macronuclear) [Paramecium tetraurelia]|uniref:Uncharacterized protein n=1 Tax=Paramecium tetraurelia TaxID=5888 RepID=A0BT37_PARTE|nr:uncharacterized protein GSPATT00031936001 [Paramecium tetraurelia]CAK61704.1 unnamed protein product [Paramecium tetraurelia]|eukprot:XP_001429102.1 hypothetical protein (macronuclear) [Paramecium tetraurelia strain d4-2]